MEKRRVSLFIPIRVSENKLDVYLQLRSANMQNPNKFGIFGGGADGDEDSEQTLVREIKEEMDFDLDLDTVDFFEHYEFSGSVRDIFIFHAPADWEKGITVKEGEYGQWFSSE